MSHDDAEKADYSRFYNKPCVQVAGIKVVTWDGSSFPSGPLDLQDGDGKGCYLVNGAHEAEIMPFADAGGFSGFTGGLNGETMTATDLPTPLKRSNSGGMVVFADSAAQNDQQVVALKTAYC